MASQWDQERVLQAIRSFHQQGLSLTTVWRHDRSLYYAGWRHFGSWQEALVAAGFERTQRKWSPERVLAALRDWQRQGVPMHKIAVVDRRLCSAAYHYFRDWQTVLHAAGIAPTGSRRWTKQRVIEELRAWQAQGRPVKSLWREFPPLCEAMRKCFGSQGAALAAAGIQEGRRWSHQRVIGELRRLGRRKRQLSCSHVEKSLVSAAHRLFGSWNAAVTAAGFHPTRTSRTPRRQWTRQKVLHEIHRLHQRGLPLTKATDPQLFHSASRLFGNWSKALVAARLEPRPRRRWSKQALLDELRRLFDEGQFDRSSRVEDRRLYDAAERFFGRWSVALRAAGVLPPGQTKVRTKYWTRQRVVEAIQDLYIRGRPLTYSANKRLYAAALARFGNWSKALMAAGVPQSARRAGHSGERST